MGREFSRHELLVEASAAAIRLGEFGSRGDRRRFSDDEVFQYAIAFAWLRLAEPLCRLTTRRLVDDQARREWQGMCEVRNMLAHERDQDINYPRLWQGVRTTLDVTQTTLDRLVSG